MVIGASRDHFAENADSKVIFDHRHDGVIVLGNVLNIGVDMVLLEQFQYTPFFALGEHDDGVLFKPCKGKTGVVAEWTITGNDGEHVIINKGDGGEGFFCWQCDKAKVDGTSKNPRFNLGVVTSE